MAVDLLGGDDAPAVVVDGALRACGADPDLHLVLVGPAEVAGEVLGALAPSDRDRVTVRPARGSVGMADAPTRASRPETSVRAAVTAVAEGQADGLVSAGASGAIVTAAVLGLGR
ncbi:MAG TPA: phosphate acyltransferase PlsX, partial [Actinoplanes sp.]|nr:phosphate acyltransferase PlsX [Actinoplanes sp.]